MKRFLVRDLPPDGSVIPGPNEEHHMRHVMRIGDGEHVALFDGAGREYEAEVTSSDSIPTICRIIGPLAESAELPMDVTVYQALIKGGHFDYAVQKSVEAGAACIVPVLMERCVRKPGKAENFIAREQRIAQEAARQCGRSVVPTVAPCMTLAEVAAQAAHELLLVAYEGEERRTLRDVLEGQCPRDMGIVIGPEGGFTAAEIAELTAAGAKCVSLGPRILRAETAAPYALAQVSYVCER